MCSRLQDEIRQSRPFRSPQQEAFLNLGRTWAVLEHALAEVLKPHGVTPTQYNVLRILRGAGKGGLCRGEVSDRMITPVPDATRLLDRMEAVGLIRRQRDADDRRYVTTTITEEGLALLARLDPEIDAFDRRHFEGLGEKELGELVALLERIRAPC